MIYGSNSSFHGTIISLLCSPPQFRKYFHMCNLILTSQNNHVEWLLLFCFNIGRNQWSGEVKSFKVPRGWGEIKLKSSKSHLKFFVLTLILRTFFPTHWPCPRVWKKEAFWSREKHWGSVGRTKPINCKPARACYWYCKHFFRLLQDHPFSSHSCSY